MSFQTIISHLSCRVPGQGWVFRVVIQDIFPYLFGKATIARNRLKLTDEDPSEYATMERLIFTDTNYSDMKLMLCVFHAIWGPFKVRIRKYLPETQRGRAYGE